MRTASRLLPGLLVLFAPMFAPMMVWAHDPLPTNWCPVQGTQPVVAARYNFTPAALQAYRSAREPKLQTNSTNGTCSSKVTDCGIVDDWYWANRMAQEYCANGTAQTASTYRSAFPLQSPNISMAGGPNSFGSMSHHSDYQFTDGNLVGACYACVPISAAPIDANMIIVE